MNQNLSDGLESGLEDLIGPAVHMNRKTRRKLRRQVLELEGHDCYATWKKAIDDEVRQRGGHMCTEVFSVPRVTEQFHGSRKGKAYDLVLGDDVCKPEHRKRVMNEIREDKPFCVILSPPCTMFSSRRRPGNDKDEEERRIREDFYFLVSRLMFVCYS